MNRIARTAGRFLSFVMLVALLALDATAAGPLGINDCVLWLDASQLTGLSDGQQVNTWPDMSGAGNHATRQGGSPLYKPNQLNGKPVVRFSTDGKSWFQFNNMTDIRTVFWVIKEVDTTYYYHRATAFLLGDDDKLDFHRKEPPVYRDGGWEFDLWHSNLANPNILNGTTKLDGNVVDGTQTGLGTGYRLVSVVTAGAVEASRLSDDRGIIVGEGRSWPGDIAEIIIYNRALTTDEENQVGYYLKQKYDITAANYTPPPIMTGSVLFVG